MSWLADDWRLKLLAFGLAVLMLGAVAFSQTPATTRTFHPPVSYTLPSTLIILNPQRTVTATVYGLSDTVDAMSDNSLTATVDASKVDVGQAVKVNIVIHSLAGGVTVLNPVVPIALNIDARATEELPVQVFTHPVAGWSVITAVALCGSTSPCKVHFDGPVSWEKKANLSASVNYITPIQATSYSSDNWPVELRNSNGVIDSLVCATNPPCGLDITTVSVSVTAKAGTTNTTVALVDSPPSAGPPPGYRITRIEVGPPTLVITGDPAVLARVQRIMLPAVDLSNATSTVTVQVNIPYPDGVTPLNGLQTAKVTYTIEKNPSVSPSP